MLSIRQFFVQILFILNVSFSYEDDIVFTIDEENPINIVNDKFISFTVDPAILLTDFNISTNSRKLAEHLYPAYVRIGGPTTKFIKYIDDDQLVTNFDNDTMSWSISRPIWASVNEWIKKTNLTSIFCINGNVHSSDWNKVNQLLNYTDKLNITTHWQLNYDCANKTIKQYNDDLMSLYRLIQDYPNKKDSWKIVASDISKCSSTEPLKENINGFENVTIAMLLEPSTESTFSKPATKGKVPSWIIAPKYPNPITFADGILWAKQLGDAATNGYSVIFRQPRVREFLSDSPIYWISIIHKRLMGRGVLEVKSIAELNMTRDVFLFCHCFKNVDSSSNSGAITIFFVNNGTKYHDAIIKSSISSNANIELQSYILTSTSDNSADIFLNGRKLLFEDLDKEELVLKPKITILNVTSNLKLNLEPKSIGFFVIPSVKISACSNSKSDIDMLMDEINKDQDLDLLDDIVLSPRFGEEKKSMSINQVYKMMEKELETDETFYKKAIQKNQNVIDDWKKLLLSSVRDSKLKKPLQNEIKSEKPKDQVTDKTKISDINTKKLDVNKLLLGRNKELDRKKELKKALLEDLTSEEADKILQQRQKNKIYEKYKLNSSELDDLFSLLVKKFKRSKRAINIELLNKHTKDSSNEDISLNNKFQELEKQITPMAKGKTNINKSSKPLYMMNAPRSNSKKSDNFQFKAALNNFASIEDSLDDHAFFDKLGFTVIKSKASPKEAFEAELEANNLDDDEYTLEDDIQAYLKTKNKGGLLKTRRNNGKTEDLVIPKLRKTIVDFDTFYDDLDSIHKFKRSPPSKESKRLLKRKRRQSLLDKLNIRKDSPLQNIFTDKNLLLTPSLDDNILKLKSYLEGDVIEDIKQKLEDHRDKIKEKNDEILQKIEDIKSQLRLTRSLKDNINMKDKGEGTDLLYKYVPLLYAHKNWKPEQLIIKGKMQEERKLKETNKLKQEILRQELLRIRRDDNDVRENEIDSNENDIFESNSILKESKMLSNNMKEINNNNTNFEQGNVKVDAEESKKEIATTKGGDILAFDDDQIINTTLYTYDDKNQTLTPKLGTTKEHFQKINLNFKPNFFEKMLNAITTFFSDIEQKMSYFFT